MASTTTAVKTKPPALGSLIDRLWASREEKRKIEDQLKEVGQAITDLEEQVMAAMDEGGMEKATGKKGSVSITTQVVANVEDWDALYPFIAKNKYWHLLQRRASDPGFRELWDAGKKTPGVQPFTKKKLNLRTVA